MRNEPNFALKQVRIGLGSPLESSLMGAKQVQPLSHRRELIVVLTMTVIGGLIRLWMPARLGLVHFDEGIYALAGLWPLDPKGFWGIDPTVIAYAPGGYPFLIGLASFGLGVGDLTPILVSILMGTLIIPVAAWLSWRTFGPTAGAITATFASFSGFHIAFSRMGLTDASFLFLFLLALGLGQRFLERPNLLNTIGLGIGVGLAQWFKYHGWLIGAIVALTALVNAVLDPAERKPRRLAAVWGQGACAGLIAFAVFWPWFSFVDTHGGYARLLRHHASYMKGLKWWYADLQTQLSQAMLLGQGSDAVAAFRLAAVFVTLFILGHDWGVLKQGEKRTLGRGLLLGMIGISTAQPHLCTGGPWALGLLFLPFLLRDPASRSRLFGLWWVVFTLLTPLYHPYVRLWLPLEACGWIVVGAVLATGLANLQAARPLVAYSRHDWRWLGGSALLTGVLLIPTMPGARGAINGTGSFVEWSDSLRVACRQVQADLPKDLTRLRFLGRPAITYYLATAGVPLATQPDLDGLLKPGAGGELALVDDALLRQEADYTGTKSRLTEGWEIVKEYPSQLNLPTLLDLNPGAARKRIESPEFECPLWLLRPRSKGTR